VDSVSKYVDVNCKEGILVRSYHATTLRLEAAFQFSTKRVGAHVRRHLRTEKILKCLTKSGGTPNDWDVSSRIHGSVADRRHASYDSLRARTLDPLHGEWRTVLDSAPRERLGAAAGPTAGGSASGLGPAGGVGGGAAAGVGVRADTSPRAAAPGPAAQGPSAAVPAPRDAAVAAAPPAGGVRRGGAAAADRAGVGVRADTSPRAAAPGPAAPGTSAAVAAPCDSAEVGPLCGQNRSTFIRVVVRVNACHSSIAENAGLEEAGPSFHADPYLASGVVDAASQYLKERQMDHILSTAVTGPQRGGMELVCVASAPGLVDTLQTARDLRRAIEDAFAGFKKGLTASSRPLLMEAQVRHTDLLHSGQALHPSVGSSRHIQQLLPCATAAALANISKFWPLSCR
jgi:hypothetical protein